MADKPTSMRLTEDEQRFLTRVGRGATEQLRDDLAMLEALLRRAEAELAGKFTVEEALLLCDLLRGTAFTPGLAASARQILMEDVLEAFNLDGLDTKWGVDKGHLMEELAALSNWRACVLVEQARRFWADTAGDVRERAARIFRTR